MRIVVDADACPSLSEIAHLALSNNIECHFFCDYSHHLNIKNAKIHYISQGYQMVDIAISNFIKAKDILITADYGLACIALSKQACAINSNGNVYDNKNIDTLIEQRYLGYLNRKRNIKTKNQKKRTNEINEKFLTNLQNLIDFNKNS